MTADELVAEVLSLRDRGSREDDEVNARLGFLADVGQLVASPLNYRDTLGAVARLAVPFLADLCFVDIVEEGGAARRLAAAFANPAGQAELSERLKSPLVIAAASPQARVIASSQAELDTAGTRSVMVVPLVARGHMLGALTFASPTPIAAAAPAISRSPKRSAAAPRCTSTTPGCSRCRSATPAHGASCSISSRTT